MFNIITFCPIYSALSCILEKTRNSHTLSLYTVHLAVKSKHYAINHIDQHPVDCIICFVNKNPLDSNMIQWTVLST